MRRLRRRERAWSLALTLLVGCSRAPVAPAPDADAAIRRGLAFLRAQQSADGSYGDHPGLTSLALLSFARCPPQARPSDGPHVARAVAYLEKLARPDGSVVAEDNPGYSTALAILAFEKLGVRADLVRAGRRYLAAIQSEDGGIGYGRDGRSDLSNLVFALDALVATEGLAAPVFVAPDTTPEAEGQPVDHKAVLRRARAFIERCQGPDGGFRYQPEASKAGALNSYGSMTYAGVRSLVYCEVPRDDPRVVAAWRWIRDHYTLESHPGMGGKGLYYYYQTFAQTLRLWGEREIVDARGVKHDWRRELRAKLVSLQRADGAWRNDDPQFWEQNPILATTRALLALAETL
ncbi:MAG: prenyltransferase/squalene oxidase repeat-containing protein [Myxococcota bacterium]